MTHLPDGRGVGGTALKLLLFYLHLQVSAATNKDDFHTNLEDILQLVDIAGCSGLMSFDKRDQLVNQLCRFLLLQRLREPLDQ